MLRLFLLSWNYIRLEDDISVTERAERTEVKWHSRGERQSSGRYIRNRESRTKRSEVALSGSKKTGTCPVSTSNQYNCIYSLTYILCTLLLTPVNTSYDIVFSLAATTYIGFSGPNTITSSPSIASIPVRSIMHTSMQTLPMILAFLPLTTTSPTPHPSPLSNPSA